jgi:hypothetical protein
LPAKRSLAENRAADPVVAAVVAIKCEKNNRRHLVYKFFCMFNTHYR